MRDRFPLLVIAGLVLLAFAISFVVKGAARGRFADVLSTYRAEPDGARGLFLLAQESGLPVDRLRTDLMILDKRASVALIGLEFGCSDLAKEKIDQIFGVADAGTSDEDELETRRGLKALDSHPIDPDEREKLLEHVKKGHTLIFVPDGAEGDPLLEALHVNSWRAQGALGIRTLVPSQPSPYTAGVKRVEARVKRFFGLP